MKGPPPEMLNILSLYIYPKPAFGIYPECMIIISVHILRISGLSKFNISGGGRMKIFSRMWSIVFIGKASGPDPDNIHVTVVLHRILDK